MNKIKQFLVVFFLLLTVNLAADIKTDVYRAETFSQNGKDHDDIVALKNICLRFYQCDNKKQCFCTQSRKDKTQSYGIVESLEEASGFETDTNRETHSIWFDWYFQNTYDDVQGKASVMIRVTRIDNKDFFEAQIIVVDQKLFLKYTGYIEKNK